MRRRRQRLRVASTRRGQDRHYRDAGHAQVEASLNEVRVHFCDRVDGCAGVRCRNHGDDAYIANAQARDAVDEELGAENAAQVPRRHDVGTAAVGSRANHVLHGILGILCVGLDVCMGLVSEDDSCCVDGAAIHLRTNSTVATMMSESTGLMLVL